MAGMQKGPDANRFFTAILPRQLPSRFASALVGPALPRSFVEAVEEALEEEPPEFDLLWSAITSYLNGNESSLRAFIKQHVGHKTPPYVLLVLKNQDIGELDLWEVWEHVEHHRAQLQSRNSGKDTLEEVPRIRSGIKKYGSVDLALDALAVQGQKREQVLREMIPGVAYVEQSNLTPESKDKLPGQVASQIRREGLEWPDEPDKVFSPELETLWGYADYREVQAFALREFEIDVDASPQELESWEAAVLLGNSEAAQLLGRSANQIGQEKYRTNAKFRCIV
jgi:hypothetical protein